MTCAYFSSAYSIGWHLKQETQSVLPALLDHTRMLQVCVWEWEVNCQENDFDQGIGMVEFQYAQTCLALLPAKTVLLITHGKGLE
jgi:hypothetical protein